MKKLFYVVQKETQSVGDNDGVEETTGYKSVRVYDLENGQMTIFCNLNIPNEDDSEEAILEYCDDNGLGDETINLINL